MASFTQANILDIENRIQAAIAIQTVEIGTVLENGRAQVEEARRLLGDHVQSIVKPASRGCAIAYSHLPYLCSGGAPLGSGRLILDVSKHQYIMDQPASGPSGRS